MIDMYIINNMSRAYRVKFKGATYHVFSRGDHKAFIFYDPKVINRFLEKLGESAFKRGVTIYAYCVMGNHYHLLIQTADANISEFMHDLNSSYANYLVAEGWVGHVFAGRYHSPCVEEGDHFFTINRYVHLNPIRAGIVDRPEDYPWSSYRAYVGAIDAPAWLDVGGVLGQLGCKQDAALEAFRSLMLKNDAEEASLVMEKALARAIFGSEKYVERIRELLAGENIPKGTVGRKLLLKTKSLADAYLETLAAFGINKLRLDPWEVDVDKRLFLEARKAFIFVSRKHTTASNLEIADMIGGIGAQAVSYHYNLMKKVEPVEGTPIWGLDKKMKGGQEGPGGAGGAGEKALIFEA
jgi:putative transposase